MNPARLSVTFPATAGLDSLDAAIPVFHRLIQRGQVEGLVIDVADYRHVPRGPGVLLVGHDVDYGINEDSLTVTRKRQSSSAAEQLRDAVRMGLGLLDSLAYDNELEASFDRSRATVAIIDRTLDPEAVNSAEETLGPVVREIWGDEARLTTPDRGDARQAPRLEVDAPESTGDTALDRLGGSQIPGQSPFDIKVEELVRLRDSGEEFTLLDVREQSELEIATLGGTNIPLADLDDNLDQLDRNAHIVVHCRAGRRGAKATTALREAGFDNAWNLNGGLMAWRDRVDPSIPSY